jgi:hypothetical protein
MIGNNTPCWGGATWMETKMLQELHVLIEMTDELLGP